MGETPTKLQSSFASFAATDVVSKVIEEQSKYWRSVTPTHFMPSCGDNMTRLHGVFWKHQADW